jgi:ABC-type nitrate/sulfonate/bicarbonate transport system ATPase subunit
VTGASKPLSVRGIAKTYQSKTGEPVEALLPIDLEIAAGEFLAIVGPSGCGKSTLLNMLAGFGEPSRGEARVGDMKISGPDIDRGMVFQSYALFPWLSVIGNVEFGLERKGVPRRERREIALEHLRLVGLQDFADRGINELSGGMKQRAAIARAFAPEPSIIFMDEPFGALDALTRRFLQGQLLRIWQRYKKTVALGAGGDHAGRPHCGDDGAPGPHSQDDRDRPSPSARVRLRPLSRVRARALRRARRRARQELRGGSEGSD